MNCHSQLDKFEYIEFVNNLLNELQSTDPLFASSLKKWRYLIDKTVYRLSKYSSKSLIDVFEEMIVPLVRTLKIYDLPTYRYAGNIYELLEEKNGKCHISSNRLNAKHKKDLWVDKALIKPVGQIPLSSSIYRKIQQEASTQATSIFCQKRGYFVVDIVKSIAKLRNGGFKNNCGVIDKKTVEKRVDEICVDFIESIESPIFAKNFSYEIEKSLCLKDFFEKNKKYLSKEAQEVFESLFSGYSQSDSDLNRDLKMSRRKVKFAKREIRSLCNEYFDREIKKTKFPVQLKASLV